MPGVDGGESESDAGLSSDGLFMSRIPWTSLHWPAWPIGSAGNSAGPAGDVTGSRSARAPKLASAKDFQEPSTSGKPISRGQPRRSSTGPRISSAPSAGGTIARRPRTEVVHARGTPTPDALDYLNRSQ